MHTIVFTNFKALTVILAVGMLSSCGVYRQNIVNIPLNTQKGDVKICGAKSANYWEVQGSAALSNHFAIMANGAHSGMVQKKYSQFNVSKSSNTFLEGGFGFYNTNPSGFISEFFLLAGQGSSYYYVSSMDSLGHLNEEIRDANFNRIRLQSDFGMRGAQTFFAVSPGFSIVRYKVLEKDGSSFQQLQPVTHVYPNVAATVGFNLIKGVALFAQGDITYSFSKSAFYEFSPLNVAGGVAFSLNTAKKKQRTKIE